MKQSALLSTASPDYSDMPAIMVNALHVSTNYSSPNSPMRWGLSVSPGDKVKKSRDRGECKSPRDFGATHSVPPERGTLSLPRPMPPCPSGWGVHECVRSVMSNSLGSADHGLLDSADHGLPGSSVHRIFQVRILGWVAILDSRRSPQARDPTLVSCASCIAAGFFTAAPPAKP